MTLTHKVEEPVELSSAQIIQMPGTQSAPVHLVSSTELAPVPDVLLPKPKRRRKKATRTRTKKVSPASAASASDAMDAQPVEDGAAVVTTAAAPLDLADMHTRLVSAMCAPDPQPRQDLDAPVSWGQRFAALGQGSAGAPPSRVADDSGLLVRFMAAALVAMAILGGTLGWFFW